MAGTLIPTRDQLKRWCSDSQGTDEDLLRKIEQVFFGVEQIPGLEDGVDNNTLAISTLSDLVRPITIDPIQPLSAQISSNTTYTLIGGEATEGMKTILIPAAYLVASAGGPFTLTIKTASGTGVSVPISTVGDTISSGDLIFDIYLDSSGNAKTKAWQVTGSNSNGTYSNMHDGTSRQRGDLVTAMNGGGAGTTGTKTITLPFTLASATYDIGASTLISVNLATFWEFYARTTTTADVAGWVRDAIVSSQALTCMWRLEGVWRA